MFEIHRSLIHEVEMGSVGSGNRRENVQKLRAYQIFRKTHAERSTMTEETREVYEDQCRTTVQGRERLK